MLKSARLLAVLALALLGPAVCLGAPAPQPSEQAPAPTPLGAPEAEPFDQSIPKRPRHAAIMRRAKIRSGLAQVQKCMTKSQIRSLLGTADTGRQLYGPKGPGEKWLGSSWMYYLSTQDEALSGIDATVEVFFDTGDRAHWIVPSHIRNAREIGSPNEKCTQPPA